MKRLKRDSMRVSKQRLIANNDSKKCRRLWDLRFEGELVGQSQLIEADRSQSKPIEDLHFFEALIDFDRFDNHFD